jgi:hypothetical protein
VAAAARLKLVLEVQVEALPLTLEPLGQLVLLEQTLVRVAQIQVAAQEQEIQLTQAQRVMEALELSSFATLILFRLRQQPQVLQQSLLLAAIVFTLGQHQVQ